MTLKQIKEHYTVVRLDDGTYLLINDHSYVCSLEKKNTRFRIVGTGVYFGDIEMLLEAIQNHISDLEYPSDLYNPLYRDGVFEDKATSYYFRSLGFTREDYCWVKEMSDSLVKIKDEGLDLGDDGDLVAFHLLKTNHEWITVTCDKNITEIKNAIDKLIYPEALRYSVDGFLLLDQLDNIDMTQELIKNTLTDKGVVIQTDYKEELKKKLIDLLEKL